MTVSLRIVGIFYHQQNIPHQTDMTVMDVLNYARGNPEPNANTFGFETGKLQIGPDAGKLSISSFYADYKSAFQSETSGFMYGAGSYYLPEDLNATPAYTVWQYYVFSEPLQGGGAVYHPNNPRVESFVDAVVPDGGFV